MRSYERARHARELRAGRVSSRFSSLMVCRIARLLMNTVQNR